MNGGVRRKAPYRFMPVKNLVHNTNILTAMRPSVKIWRPQATKNGAYETVSIRGSPVFRTDLQ